MTTYIRLLPPRSFRFHVVGWQICRTRLCRVRRYLLNSAIVVCLMGHTAVQTSVADGLLVLQRVRFRPTSTCVSRPSASTRTAGTSTSCTTSFKHPLCSDVSSLSEWMCSRCLFDMSLERPRVDAVVLLRNKIVLPLRRFGIRGTW